MPGLIIYEYLRYCVYEKNNKPHDLLAAVVVEDFDFDGFVGVSGAEVVHPPLGGPPHRRQVVLDDFAPANHHKVAGWTAPADDVKGVALAQEVLPRKQNCCHFE